MILAVHQPNYLPWPGFFYKMAQSDIFIILDSVQLTRSGSLDNRNFIKTPQGAQLLTVPVKRKGLNIQRFDEAMVIPGWKDKHLKALKLNYGKAPYFTELFQQLEKIFQDSGYLLNINFAFIKLVYDLLKLQTRLVFSSSLPQFFNLHKTELIVALCGYFSADCYLSGQGGSVYNQLDLFEKNNLKLEYLDYQPATYSQLWGSFIPNLSIVDMLFNCGPELTRNLLLKERQV